MKNFKVINSNHPSWFVKLCAEFCGIKKVKSPKV
ncbi:MAG: hypothetical protein ACJATN_002473 [Neolewinella sp.]|jgi:hypothetical protein